jgi:hypothetical protein
MNEGEQEVLRRRGVKASGEAGAPRPDITSEDGVKRKGRSRGGCRNDLWFLRRTGQPEKDAEEY